MLEDEEISMQRQVSTEADQQHTHSVRQNDSFNNSLGVSGQAAHHQLATSKPKGT